jgi:hypothetical protein
MIRVDLTAGRLREPKREERCMALGVGVGRMAEEVGWDVESWGDDMHICLVSSDLSKMPKMVECEE